MAVTVVVHCNLHPEETRRESRQNVEYVVHYDAAAVRLLF